LVEEPLEEIEVEGVGDGGQPDAERVVEQAGVDQRKVGDGQVLRYDQGLGGTISVARMPPRITLPKAGFSLDRAYAAAVQNTSWRIQAPVGLDDRVPQVGRQLHQVPGVGVAAEVPVLRDEGGRRLRHLVRRLQGAGDHPVHGEEEGEPRRARRRR
jgi:hypothetical protein